MKSKQLTFLVLAIVAFFSSITMFVMAKYTVHLESFIDLWFVPMPLAVIFSTLALVREEGY